ncbi:MAG: hypothetical protein HOJ35_08130 [Bdellovibrionales bacterium]|nr:hypothetical protein [Bdellovibrionales bacterium]
MKTKGIIIFIVIGMNILSANDQVVNTRDCLYKCLDQIPQLRRMFDIVLYNLHNQILSTIDQSKYIIENKVNSPHPTIQILNSDNLTPELIEQKQKLMTSYQALYGQCLKSKTGDNSTSNSVNNNIIQNPGNQTFSISSVLSNPNYKYKVQDAIAKGMGISIHDIDYDPSTMQFTIRLDNQGQILPNFQQSNKVLKVDQLRSVAQNVRSPREQRIDRHRVNQARKNAHYMILGSILSINNENNCKLKTRGEEIESYCLNSLLTSVHTVKTETGLKTNILSPITSALYITPSVQLSNPDDLRIVNNTQVKDILKLIRLQACKARNLLVKKDKSINAFSFKIPCETTFTQEIPKAPNIVNRD